MALMPNAEHKLIPPGANDPPIKARMGILHVDAGNIADLYNYFKNHSGGIESHFHIRKDGSIQQYRDTAFEADANYKANDFAISFETQGFADGEWTNAQLEAIKDAMRWCNMVHGIPYRLVESWNDPKGGWGYHTLFGSPSKWTPVAKSCPGPERKAQFHKILVPWMKEQNTVAFTESDRKEIAALRKQVSDLDGLVRKRFGGVADRQRRLTAEILKAEGVSQEGINKILEKFTAE